MEISRFVVIILSKNDVTWSWCLDELMKIVECRNVTKKKVFPIFFVNPLMHENKGILL